MVQSARRMEQCRIMGDGKERGDLYETLVLSALLPGESAYVTEVNARPAMVHRLTQLGLLRGTRVKCMVRSSGGDSCACLIRGALIALGREDTDGIWLERFREEGCAEPAGK